ncbi:MAG: magnesium transporter [Pseudomonadota bacterium]
MVGTITTQKTETGPQVAPKKWRHEETETAVTANQALVAEVEELIREHQEAAVLTLLEDWAPVDVVSLLVALRFKRARRLVSWLPDDIQMGVLSEIDPRMHAVLYEKRTRKRIAKLLRRLDHDRALHLLEALPDDLRDDLVAAMDNAETWRKELAYLEDSAGSIMRRRVLAVRPEQSIAAIKEDLRTHLEEFEKLEAIYVVAADRQLIGYLRVRDLLLQDDRTCVEDLVRTDLVAVDSNTDQEEVLRLAARRGLRVVAVRDEAGRLVGSVTPKELTLIAREEAEEDMLLMAGVSPEATSQDTPLQIVKSRLPWLLAGLIGAAVAAMVIGTYEEALEKAAILASFIPVVMAMAGNAGIQASTVTVQGLTAGTIWPGDMWGRILREITGAAINGAAVALVVAILIFGANAIIEVPRPLQLAFAAGMSLILATTFASAVGAAVPVILDKLRMDPAVATGIFITTANDVFGVLIFFVMASALYL